MVSRCRPSLSAAQAALDPGTRLVVAISVPTRAGAAAFLAAGISAALYREWSPGDAAAHFEKLAALPAGTYVTYKAEHRLHCGTLDRVEIRDGEAYVRINGNGYGRRWDMCGGIHPLAEGEELFSGTRKISEASEFVTSALGVSASDYGMSSAVSCLLVGPKERLVKDLTEQRFSAAAEADGNAKRPVGTLQDILRCRAVGGVFRSLYRSDILPAQAPKVPRRLASCSPAAVILDGAQAFLKRRSDFPTGLFVAIFDRSAPGSEAAAYALRDDRARSLRDVEEVPAGPVPPGVEVLTFEEEELCA